MTTTTVYKYEGSGLLKQKVAVQIDETLVRRQLINEGIATAKVVVEELFQQTANARDYNSIDTACAYAAYPNPFQLESQQFVAFRGACWAKAYEILGAVEQNLRPIPTKEELLAEMPVFGQVPLATPAPTPAP